MTTLIEDRPAAGRRAIVTLVLAVVGFAGACASMAYIAGLFGISAALASQIVHAVEVGGLALAIVMGLLSGGVAATIIATARWAIAKWGERVAIA